MAALDPELDVAAAAMAAEGARFVVVGGFAVIANRFVRATEDVDFLVPDDVENDGRVLAALVKLRGVRLRDKCASERRAPHREGTSAGKDRRRPCGRPARRIAST
jgi:hypothetical protein